MPEGLKICLIDDDVIYQFAAKKMIELTGFAQDIAVFTNGEQAITFLQEHAQEPNVLPDVIFLDINMPVMNGWEFLELYEVLKPTLSKQISVFLVSSSNDEYDINRSKEFSAVASYIVKPINLDIFTSVLAPLSPK